MLGRKIATYWISWFYVLFALSVPLSPAPHADRDAEAGGQMAPTARMVPEKCKATEKPPGPIETLLQKLVSGPSAETYEALGMLYGGAGNFKCAIAAFDAALAVNPKSTQARYHLGLALTQNHESSRAADELHAVLREEPNSFSAHNALGLALQDLGRLEEAANEFKTALRINPRFALASYDLSQLLSSEKNYQAAIYYLKEGLANSPTPGLAYELRLALAVAYAQIGKYSESIPLFQEAVASHPDSAELHFNLATAYAHCDDYLPAVKEYKAVLRLDPKHNAAELSLAKALLNLNAREEALAYVEDYAHRNPSDLEGQQILGEALKDTGDVSQAISVLERAVRMDPANYKAHSDLGVVLSRSGRDKEAIHELQTAIKLNPEGTEARYQLLRILAKRKEEPAATQQVEAFQLLRQNADRETIASSLNNQANEFLRQGRAKEAAEDYEQALLLEPKDARLHFNLALSLSQLEDQAGEERELENAIKLDPQFAQAHNRLGSHFMIEGRFSEAEREFRAAVETNPRYAEALSNLGTLFGRQGRNKEAAALFRKAVALDPQYVQALVNLGLTLAAEGSFVEAEQQFQDALRREPNNTNALTALGMLQGKTRRSPEAVQTFRKLTGLYPASADAHVNLGIALGDNYDLDGALREFSEAIRCAPNSPLAHYNRGRVLYALGRKDDARQELDTAVRLSPNYTDALFLLGVIEHSSPYATELFERVVDLEPGNSQARVYLGRNLLQQGKKDEAITQWKKAAEADPDNLSALSSLARTLAQLHSPEAGKYLTQLEALQERRQLTDRVKQLNNFALQSANENNWPQAVSQIQEAIEHCRRCPLLGILRKNSGLIYARKGDVETAKEQLQLALKLLPGGPDAILVEETLRRLTSQSSTPHQTR